MTRLLAFVVLLALVLGAADVASRIVVQHQLEQRVDSYVPPGTSIGPTQVKIDSFPFLAKLATAGRIDKITAHARSVAQGDFVMDRVDITVTGVKINRSRLLHERKLEIVSIATGTVNIDMTQAAFQTLVGAPVTLGSGSAQLTVAGVKVTARVSVANGRLRLQAAGLPVSVPIPSLPVLPCLAQVTIVPGHLLGSCTFHEIPPALNLALQ